LAKYRIVLEESKKGLFLHSEIQEPVQTRKFYTDETNISTIEQEKKKQTRLQGKDVYSERKKNCKSKAFQRKKKTDGFGRTET